MNPARSDKLRRRADLPMAGRGPRVRRDHSRVSKWFSPSEEERARVEVAVHRICARRGLSGGLLEVHGDHRGTEIVSEAVGRPWPRRPSATSVSLLARALAALHRSPPPPEVMRGGRKVRTALRPYASATVSLMRLVESAEGIRPKERRILAEWRRRFVSGLSPHLRSLERHHRSAPRALCHGDLTAANLRIDGRRVLLIDLESARYADPAWELANASLLLGLTAALEDVLINAYLSERGGGGELSSRLFGYRLVGIFFVPFDVLARRSNPERTGRHHVGPSLDASVLRLIETGRETLRWLTGRAPPSLVALAKRLRAGCS